MKIGNEWRAETAKEGLVIREIEMVSSVLIM
jgi:hypothetical protein